MAINHQRLWSFGQKEEEQKQQRIFNAHALFLTYHHQHFDTMEKNIIYGPGYYPKSRFGWTRFNSLLLLLVGGDMFFFCMLDNADDDPGRCKLEETAGPLNVLSPLELTFQYVLTLIHPFCTDFIIIYIY